MIPILSDVVISTVGLGSTVQFHDPFLFPTVKHFFSDVAQPLSSVHFCELIKGYLGGKDLMDSEMSKIDPKALCERLFRRPTELQGPAADKVVDLARWIEARDFASFIDQAALEEKDDGTSEALRKLSSWLQDSTRSEKTDFQIPSVPAARAYPIAFGLHFPADISPGTYNAEVLITGKNFVPEKVPIAVEIFDSWSDRWESAKDYVKVLLSALVGALVNFWFTNRKRNTPSAGDNSEAEVVVESPS